MTIDIKPFVDTILGKADSIKPSISPDLEQALMHRMDPARLKRQAISQGLLAFAQKLGSTPGHFLQGMGQAAPVGVGTYKDDMEKGLDTRISTLDTLNKGKRQDDTDQLERAQTSLKTGMAVNKYETDKTSEATKAQQDVRKFNMDMARDEAEVDAVYNDMISQRWQDLGLDNPELIGEERAAAEKKYYEYRQNVDKALGNLKQRHGILGNGKGAMTDPQQEQTKTIDGVTYVKKNGKWFVQGR
jgi:hypothetical protein